VNLVGMQTLDETLEMLTILPALGETTLAGLATFCAVFGGTMDVQASTAVAGA